MTYAVCSTEDCGSSDFYDVMERRLMWMTMMAHKAVLFEKIKQKIEEKEGAKLDKIAGLLVEASKAREENERQTTRQIEDFKDRFKELFEEE
ncbi:MAG: hypothetical protein HY513_00450 [Candidatus Aenigmarchaeota archaeon]|nr:hypothetical protein [Candidatus Aenigmarchaeota archaeon]